MLRLAATLPLTALHLNKEGTTFILILEMTLERLKLIIACVVREVFGIERSRNDGIPDG